MMGVEVEVTFLRSRDADSDADRKDAVIELPEGVRTPPLQIVTREVFVPGLEVVETFKLIRVRTHDRRGTAAPSAVYLLDGQSFEEPMT